MARIQQASCLAILPSLLSSEESGLGIECITSCSPVTYGTLFFGGDRQAVKIQQIPRLEIVHFLRVLQDNDLEMECGTRGSQVMYTLSFKYRRRGV